MQGNKWILQIQIKLKHYKQDLQISNRDKPIFKPDDPVLKEDIQLKIEDEMIGVKICSSHGKF